MKKTYVYRIEMGHTSPEIIDFCYARNSKCAVEGMREIYKDSRFTRFDTYQVGEADIKLYSAPFEKIEGEHLAWLKRNRGKLGEKYSARKEDRV